MILKLSYLFLIGSVMGWLIELIFRSFTAKKIISFGALKGPYLPLHGIGFILIYYISTLDVIISIKAILFLIATTLIEYLIGKYFLDVWQLRYWDYSSNRWNYKGLICPLFSIIWLMLSMLFYYFVFPSLKIYLANVILYKWLIILLFVYYLVFSIDVLFFIKKLIKKAKPQFHF